ncbi:hypothetical protein M422DRAFT_263071 [Sphaerobolus stellatus SS14]|uniref:Uncharacterized protein n=1 Tax=Sphaerobolus stellatus (strain SS14) TaxID=990650 RepID=A0A0C9TWE8_SPHS4|nr:hypothetical protein M422DRAFT_263071 [Sphaerobolus stellatus SS14]
MQLVSLVVGAVQLCFVLSQVTRNGTLPNIFPHAYPEIPNNNANFQDSKAWQYYFLIIGTLINVLFPLPRSFTRSIPVN